MLSIEETLRRIDAIGPCDDCGQHGWLVLADADGDFQIKTCPCLDHLKPGRTEEEHDSIVVMDADVRQLPEAIEARLRESRRRDAGEGPEWEYDS